MKIDLSKMKKVKSDEDSTHLQHPEGHVIKIAHGRLSPKNREELDSLPMHYASGGLVEEGGGQSDKQQPVVVNVNSGPPPVAPQPMPVMPAQPPAYDFSQALGPQVADRFQAGQPLINLSPNVAQAATPEQMALEQAQTQGAGATGSWAPPEAGGGVQVGQPGPMMASNGTELQMPAAGIPGGAGQAAAGQDALGGLMSGIGETKSGLRQEAKAIGEQGNREAAISEQAVAKDQALMKSYDEHIAGLTGEYQNFMHDIANGHINPRQYIEKMSTGGRIMTSIGLILGGMGSGLTGGPNVVLDHLNRQIDNDIKAQQGELDKKQNMLRANLQQFGNMRDAVQMTHAMQLGIVSNQLKASAAKAQDPIAKARALQAAGALDMKVAPMLQQIAQRKLVLQAQASGALPPARAVSLLVPKEQQAAAYKELAAAQEHSKNFENAMKGFEKVNKVNTVKGRVLDPKDLLTGGTDAQQLNAVLVEMSKDAGGRPSPEVLKQFKSQFVPDLTDSETERQTKKRALASFFKSKENFPTLQAYGIPVSGPGKFDTASGEKKIKLGAPVK